MKRPFLITLFVVVIGLLAAQAQNIKGVCVSGCGPAPAPTRSPSPSAPRYDYEAERQQQRQNRAHNLNEHGVAYFNQKDWKRAAESFRAALELWPDNTVIQNNYKNASEFAPGHNG
jgi:tetratricopeptide (TPR) repeat protein